MKIISNSALRAFALEHPQADAPLKGWRRVIEKNRFENWGELKAYLPNVADQRIEKLPCRNCNCGEKDVYSQSAH